MNFKTESYGKWILAGEHAVLRGAPALAFPVYGRRLQFQFEGDWNQHEDIHLSIEGSSAEDFQLLFWGVFRRAWELVGEPEKKLVGTVTIKNEIPLGAGMGASAALCVGMGRWFSDLQLVATSEIYEFSRKLENLFHGESSGVDVAVAMGGAGLLFQRDKEKIPFQPCWQPQWYLSYSGKRGVTSECVKKVKVLLEQKPEQGKSIDQDMWRAVEMAETSLKLQSEEEGLELLKNAIELAASCFQRWGLVQEELASHMKQLKEAGALAVKPTGSGGGGYVLSLWKTQPPTSLSNELIPLVDHFKK